MTEKEELFLYLDNSEESRTALELAAAYNLEFKIVEESNGRVPRLEQIHYINGRIASTVTFFGAKGVEYYLIQMYRERSG